MYSRSPNTHVFTFIQLHRPRRRRRHVRRNLRKQIPAARRQDGAGVYINGGSLLFRQMFALICGLLLALSLSLLLCETTHLHSHNDSVHNVSLPPRDCSRQQQILHYCGGEMQPRFAVCAWSRVAWLLINPSIGGAARAGCK